LFPKKKNLRQFISLVSQHAVLFRDTIRENIRLGREGASDEDVERAARNAAAEDFALKGGGLDKTLGDVGSGVSGGQRQRLAIARAFLKDAPILILDEATAALDSESEKKIQDRLEHLVRGRTTFIVAHRFSSIRIAQRILVFSQGRIVGDGPHETLYRSCALYKELYDRQGV
jgi:subfamily B ATP-binding cassette protein MsbA